MGQITSKTRREHYPPQMLGRTPSLNAHLVPRLEKYLTDKIPAPPTTRRWDQFVPHYRMDGNDTNGDCVFATADHEQAIWAAAAGAPPPATTDEEVITLAAKWNGLNGYSILKRLQRWHAIGMWGNKIDGYAAINAKNPATTKTVINAFGTADIGLLVPLAWQGKAIWDTGSGPAYEPGSWGSHSVPIAGYDENYVYAISWGATYPMSYAALATYCDEAYAVIDPTWYSQRLTTPSGIALTALQHDLGRLAT